MQLLDQGATDVVAACHKLLKAVTHLVYALIYISRSPEPIPTTITSLQTPVSRNSGKSLLSIIKTLLRYTTEQL